MAQQSLAAFRPRSSAFAVATFSIVARDPDSGDLGVATASKFLAVGAVVPFGRAGVGAGATQSFANTGYSPRALTALAAGITVDAIHQSFAATDDEHEKRQYGLVAADGSSVSFTGSDCHPWAGGVAGENVAAQGNLLAGPEVIDALVGGYRESSGSFSERLLAGLLAADRAGGDKRGRQAAALLVLREGGGYGGYTDRYIDLRVDDHRDPVVRLQELLTLHRLYFERPSEADALPIEGEVAERLLAALERCGALPAGSKRWDERAYAALEQLAGVENLEERLLGPGRIDRVVLAYLEQRCR